METCDIAIIGCGPAGLSAALNTQLRGRQAVVFGAGDPCPGLDAAPLIDNYLGLPDTSGAGLVARFLDHARRAGARLVEEPVVRLARDGFRFYLDTPDRSWQARAVIITTGNAGGVVAVERDLATATPGVWAAGDVTGRPFEVAKGVGEGQVAALNACAWLDEQDVRQRDGMQPYEVWGDRSVPAPSDEVH